MARPKKKIDPVEVEKGVGRPTEYTQDEINKILVKLEKYIKSNHIPIVAEFAHKNNIRRATLYEIPEFSYTIKKLIDKKEANLERDGLDKDKITSMHIFSLKQLGWKDRQEIDTKHSFNGAELAAALEAADTDSD